MVGKLRKLRDRHYTLVRLPNCECTGCLLVCFGLEKFVEFLSFLLVSFVGVLREVTPVS